MTWKDWLAYSLLAVGFSLMAYSIITEAWKGL